MYMCNMNWHYNRPIGALIVVSIIDQTCTFQCLIPTGDLSIYDRHGNVSPSGYGSIGVSGSIPDHTQSPYAPTSHHLAWERGLTTMSTSAILL